MVNKNRSLATIANDIIGDFKKEYIEAMLKGKKPKYWRQKYE